MLDSIALFADNLLGQVSDPRKRLFVAYLISATVIGLWLLRRQQHSHPFRALFSKHIWWSPSARADYLVLLINQGLVLLLSPLLLGRVAVATVVYLWLQELFDGQFSTLDIPAPWLALIFTLVLFLLDDASRYLLHRYMHTWPVLWAFHQVHHSARTMTPLTVYRVHPLESVLYILRSALVQGLVTALFVFAFGAQISLIEVLGASLFVFMFNLVGSNLRHSHIPFAYPAWLENWLISPFQHQLHHSSAAAHHNVNYGATLAIWDRLGRSLCRSKDQTRPRFGLSRRDHANAHSLRELYIKPVSQAVSLLPAVGALYRRRNSEQSHVWLDKNKITRIRSRA